MSRCPYCRKALDLSKRFAYLGIVKAILESKINLSQLFTTVITSHDFENHGPTYTVLRVLSSSQHMDIYIEIFAETGPSVYMNGKDIVIEDAMGEMPRLTASFLVNVVRPLVGHNFDSMFELSAVAFFLDAVKDVMKRDFAGFPHCEPPENDARWDFSISKIPLSDCKNRVFVREKMDFMKIPKNNENRLEYEKLVEALEQ